MLTREGGGVGVPEPLFFFQFLPFNVCKSMCTGAGDRRPDVAAHDSFPGLSMFIGRGVGWNSTPPVSAGPPSPRTHAHARTLTGKHTPPPAPSRQSRSPALALPQDMRGSCVSQAQRWRNSPRPPPHFLPHVALPPHSRLRGPRATQPRSSATQAPRKLCPISRVIGTHEPV